MILNEEYISNRRNRKENKKPSNEIETKYKEEKLLVSQLISHLSTTVSNDITKTDNTHNSDTSLFEKRIQLIPKNFRMSNQATNKRNEFSKNLIRGRLKNKLKEETISHKHLLKSDKQRIKTPLIEKDSNILDNSIVSKSPNCNILTRLKNDKTIEKSLLFEKNSLNSLNDSIITKSPNCAIASNSDKKKKLSKIPIFGKKSTPTIVKNPFKKIISRTPCGLISQTYKKHCQKIAETSKSLPRNFQNKISQEQESLPLFKKPFNMERKINSGYKKKDTEESSGIYSASSKIMQLKNVAMKLEDYITDDFDSLSNNNDIHNTKVIENFKQNVSNSLSNTNETKFNTSLENMTSNISDSSSRTKLKIINSTEEISNIKYKLDSNDSLSDSIVDCQEQIKSYHSQQSLLSFNQSETNDNIENCKNSFRESKNSFITADLTERSLMNR